VEQFQSSLFNHYATDNPTTIYDPAAMRAFADKHAPGLYSTILNSIKRNDARVSSEHAAVQEQRTVALLHTLAYFR